MNIRSRSQPALGPFASYEAKLSGGRAGRRGREVRDERSSPPGGSYRLSPCGNARLAAQEICGRSCGSGRERLAHPSDAECRHYPAEVIGKDMQAHLRSDGVQALAQEVGFPIQVLMVANGCSAVSRRTAMALPIASMRAASASMTASCSQRRT